MNTGGVLWYRKKMGFASYTDMAYIARNRFNPVNRSGDRTPKRSIAYAIVANLLSALAVLIPGV